MHTGGLDSGCEPDRQRKHPERCAVEREAHEPCRSHWPQELSRAFLESPLDSHYGWGPGCGAENGVVREDLQSQAEIRGDSTLELRLACPAPALLPFGVSTPILFSGPAPPWQVLWGGPE